MAQRKLNKNLVAFLTVAGMVLAVGIVAVATFNAARKDPAVIAEKALAREQNGELRGAAELYVRAFNVEKEVSYLIEASRCLYQLGEINAAIGILNRAHTQAPSDAPVLEALLERFWAVRKTSRPWTSLKEFSEKLLEIEPNNLLALVARAAALDALQSQDPSYATAAAEALEQAMKTDPDDPRVVEVRVTRIMNEASKRMAELSGPDRADEAEQVAAEARAKASEIFEQALAKYPKSTPLIVNYFQILADDARHDEARALLTQAIADQPDDSEIRFTLARFHMAEGERKKPDELTDEVAEHVAEGLAAVDKCIELEPAYYLAYEAKARLMQLGWENDGSWENQAVERKLELLAMLSDAFEQTVGLKSIKAVLGKQERAQMLANAFYRAYGFYQEHEREREAREQFLKYVEAFKDRAEREFTESVLIALMKGQYALLTGDDRGAIQAFSDAEEKAGAFGLRFELLAKERLAQLYTQVGETGLALKYTDQLLQWYADRRATAPWEVNLNRANLLNRLDRSEEALDIVDLLKLAHPDDGRIAQVRSVILQKLGRGDDAMQELGTISDDAPDVLLMKARMAAANQDLAAAERITRQILESDPANPAALSLIVRVMVQSDRTKEAIEFVQELQQRVDDEDLRRVMQANIVMLSTTDVKERAEQILALIAEITDDAQRSAEYFNYYYSREEYETAAPYADELERHRPNDVRVLEIQFELALRLSDYDRAERYVSRLAELNADRAGGMTYRGQLKLIQGRISEALGDFRAAERELPTNSNLKVQIAQALLKTGDAAVVEAAITALEMALELDPQHFRANKLLYQLLEQIGREDEGIQYLESAARTNPRDEFVKQRSQLLAEQKNPRFGIQTRELTRAAEPKNIDNLIRLAQLYLRVKEFDQSEECLKQAAEAEPTNLKMARFAADFYARRNEREAGEILLKNFIEKRSRIFKIGAYLLLADFYDQLGDREAVMEVFEQARQFAEETSKSHAERGRRGKVSVAAAMAGFHERRGETEAQLQVSRDLLPLLSSNEQDQAQRTRLNIISALLKLGRMTEAEQEIEVYRNQWPKDSRWMMTQAELLIRRNQLEEARELLTRVLQVLPNHPWALFARGRVNMGLRRFNEAKQDLLRVKGLAPRDFGLAHRVDLARLYSLLEQYELAESELRELLALRPSDQRIALLLISLLQNTHQAERAQTLVSQFITRHPESPFWPFQLARLLIARKEYSAAIRPIEQAVKLTDGKQPQYVADWILCLARGNRPNDALRTVAQLDASVVSPPVLCYAAEAHQALGDQDAAVAKLTAALRSAAEIRIDAVAFVVSRMIALIGEEATLGILRSELAQAGGDHDPGARLRWAVARQLIETGDGAHWPEAVQMIEKLLAGEPDDSKIRLEAYYLQARLHELEQKNEESVAVYEQILTTSPDDIRALNNIAYLLADELERSAEAVRYAQRARTLAPDNPNILDTLGWAYFADGQFERAESTLLEGLSWAPNNLPVLYHLGRVYVEDNRTAEARRFFSRVIRTANEEGRQDSEYASKAAEALQALR